MLNIKMSNRNLRKILAIKILKKSFKVFQKCNRKNTLNAFAVILFTLAVSSIFMHLDGFSDLERCYFYSTRHAMKGTHRNLTILQDIMEASVQPIAESSIFFIDASCRRDAGPGYFSDSQMSVANLTLRQACAVESTARINSDVEIFVLFASPVYLADDKIPVAIQAILSYTNVHMNYMNPWTITKGTPYEEWFLKGDLFECKFPSQALTDYLKLIYLWRWGGTSMDMDTLAVQPVPDILNFIAYESDTYLSTAFMNFAVTDIGHWFVQICLEKFKSAVSSDQWHATGRDLVTAVMKGLWDENCKECSFITIFSREDIAPISEDQVETLFSNLYINRLTNELDQIKPFAIYLWNRFCTRCKASLDSPGVYGLLAAKNCPKVYSLAKEYF